MTLEAPQGDLLIIGALTVDRLADGSTLAGGSVLHAARAVGAAERLVASITAAGPEPEAQAGVAELASLGPSRVVAVAASVRFSVDDAGGGRRLVLEAPSRDLAVTAAEMKALDPRCVLLAPIAGELSAASLRACITVPVRVGVLQGWLRHLVPGDEADALPLSALGDDLSAALADLDGLVASAEDLAAVAPDPRRQLAALRVHLGPRPLLVVTTGADGAWLGDAGNGVRHLAVSRRLGGTPTIGAGDAFAGIFATGLGSGLGAVEATIAAMAAAMEYLASRPRR